MFLDCSCLHVISTSNSNTGSAPTQLFSDYPTVGCQTAVTLRRLMCLSPVCVGYTIVFKGRIKTN